MSDVMIKAKVSTDGRTVSVAPGVELPRAAVTELSDMPAGAKALVLYFEDDESRTMVMRAVADMIGTSLEEVSIG